jgi:hypothetical protein
MRPHVDDRIQADGCHCSRISPAPPRGYAFRASPIVLVEVGMGWTILADLITGAYRSTLMSDGRLLHAARHRHLLQVRGDVHWCHASNLHRLRAIREALWRHAEVRRIEVVFVSCGETSAVQRRPMAPAASDLTGCYTKTK